MERDSARKDKDEAAFVGDDRKDRAEAVAGDARKDRDEAAVDGDMRKGRADAAAAGDDRKDRADAAVAGDMQKVNGEITAIILAGGFSRRMGQFKPLLKVGDRPAVDVLVQAFARAGVKRIVIVTGHKHEMLERHIDCDLTVDGLMSAGTEFQKDETAGTEKNEEVPVGTTTKKITTVGTENIEEVVVGTVFNENYSEGMFTSVQKGIEFVREIDRAAGGGVSGTFLIPVDCPAVSAETIRTMLAEIGNIRISGTDEFGNDIGTEAAKIGNIRFSNTCVAINYKSSEFMRDGITNNRCKDLESDTAEKDSFYVPTYMGKKGHPLYIPKGYWQEILEYSGENGLRGFTENHTEKMINIPVDDEGILLDMDDAAGYERVNDYYANGNGPDLQTLAKGRRIILIRHGEIQQHKEKILLGQTDVPLSEVGKMQAKAAGKKLAEICPETDRIYTSSLTRAKETAGIVVQTLSDETAGIIAQTASGETAGIIAQTTSDRTTGIIAQTTSGETAGTILTEIVTVDDFKEMSLGDWDGRYISEIRENNPEQFMARGENIFSFKTGSNSENFYDLQYRGVTALKNILKNDSRRDIVIISHKGMIRALENNLKGKSVDEPWDELATGEVRIISV